MMTALVLGLTASWVGYLLKHPKARNTTVPVERDRAGYHFGDEPMPTWARKPAAPANAVRKR